jgi:integrase
VSLAQRKAVVSLLAARVPPVILQRKTRAMMSRVMSVPGPGLRLRRAVLASGGGGALYIDTLKNNRPRTVPLVVDLVPIVDRWSAGKAPDAWLFDTPEGSGPLRESNWRRSVGWRAATVAAGLVGFRVHDLRHTAASVRQGRGVASDATFRGWCGEG